MTNGLRSLGRNHVVDRILFLLGGPSAAGKTSVALALDLSDPELDLIPRHTTRRVRGVPADRSEYVFVSPSAFDVMAKSGRFIEYRHYGFGMSYGLDRELVDRSMRRGHDCIAILNLGSLQQARANWLSAVTIYLSVDLRVLEDRMLSRGDHTEEQIAERLTNARLGVAESSEYDFVVSNEGSLDTTVDAIRDIVKAVRAERLVGDSPRAEHRCD